MTGTHIKLFILNVLLIAAAAVNLFARRLNSYALVFLVLAAGIVAVLLVGYERNRNRYERKTIATTVMFAALYTALAFMCGMLIGFVKPIYSHAFPTMVKNVLPVLLIIVTTEFLRYTIVRKGAASKMVVFTAILAFILLDITTATGRLTAQDTQGIVKFVLTTVIPSVSKNLLLTYLALKSGYLSGILFRLLLELQIFLFPIVPDFGDYIGTVLKTVYPLVLLYILYAGFEKTRRKSARRPRRPAVIARRVTAGVLIAVCVFALSIASGWFKYASLAIGSGSMTGSIDKGDVVIVRKLSDAEQKELSAGDVLVFRWDGKLVVHRLVRIEARPDGTYYFTKGDYNLSEDGYPIPQKDVVGKVSMNIKYIGYPTVWLNELFDR
ncbi:MAG: signal peptidase I [Clostridiales bacterium]|jgi:signal peptidase I|nr:signal peptidase I [Clostridiales bacterium]